jgi:hypothetical protein
MRGGNWGRCGRNTVANRLIRSNSFPLKAAKHGIDQGINVRIGEVDRIAVVWK